MANITCFKCDVCGRIEENGNPIMYVKSDVSRFEVRDWQKYNILDKGVCCDHCIHMELDTWLAERQNREADRAAAQSEATSINE